MKESCANCKFWDFDGQGPVTSDDNGDPIHENDYWADCSRFPPVLAVTHNDVNYEPVRWQKPSTAAADWCGEWRASA